MIKTMMALMISGVKDIAGNPAAAQTTHFTTAAGPQTFNPGVPSATTNPVSRNGTARMISGTTSATTAFVLTEPMTATTPSR